MTLATSAGTSWAHALTCIACRQVIEVRELGTATQDSSSHSPRALAAGCLDKLFTLSPGPPPSSSLPTCSPTPYDRVSTNEPRLSLTLLLIYVVVDPSLSLFKLPRPRFCQRALFWTRSIGNAYIPFSKRVHHGRHLARQAQ